MYARLGNLYSAQRLGSLEGEASGFGAMFGRRGLRRIERQEKQLSRMQERLQQAQAKGDTKRIQKIEENIARKTARIDRWRQRKGLGPLSVPATATVPVPVSVATPAIQAGQLAPPGFDEAKYLARHADVAHSVRMGHIPSGLYHYNRWGKQEGRALAGFSDGVEFELPVIGTVDAKSLAMGAVIGAALLKVAMDRRWI